MFKKKESMFKNFDEVEKTLLKVLSDLADITEATKKITAQQKQKGGCDDCNDCAFVNEPVEEENGTCDECKHYDECDCAPEFDTIEKEWENEKEDFDESMKWLEVCRRDFIDSFIEWMASLPYLPDAIVKDINLNHVTIAKKLGRCLENQIEPMIALSMLNKKREGKDFGIADILSVFNFKVVCDKNENRDKQQKDKEKELLNELKRAAINGLLAERK